MAFNYNSGGNGYGGQSYPNGGSYPNTDRGYGRGPQQYQGSPTNPSFNAPGVRMDGGRHDRDFGRPDQGNRGRTGLGAVPDTRNLERDRQQVRENMMSAQPPTREEVARTIFLGGLGDGAPPDSAIEAILGSAGKLRRWTRARDAEEKKCRFGFAEFEDVDSLETAKEMFEGGIEVPVFEDGKLARKEGEESQMMKILVVIDEQSTAYIDEWMSKRREGEDAKQFRLDHAREDLARCMTALKNGHAFTANNGLDGDGEGLNGAEHVEIPQANEDELADIPAEMRAQVALEIKAFRERSNRRDIDLGQSDATETRTFNRLASPPVNGAPSGPKSAVSGAPAGPKGYRGVQLPSDYVNGVNFVNGDGLADDDDSDSSDLTLENRRIERRKEEQEKMYREAEQKWIRQENRHIAAQKRDLDREATEQQDLERQRDAEAKRLEVWDDEEEARARGEQYYEDPSSWNRRRKAQRDREERDDARDRDEERREKEVEEERVNDAKGAADRFLAETGAEIDAAKQAESLNFTFNIGSSLQKTAPAARKLNDVAGMLEDEEDEAGPAHRELRAISTLPTNGDADMTDNDVASRRALIKQIPTDADSLFAWEVRWSYIRTEVLENEIRPFVEKRVADLLGMEDDFLVNVVMDGLKAQKSAEQFIQELEPVLEEETVAFVKKVWRLVVFWGEAESRRGIA